MKRSTIDIWVGILVLMGIGALLFLAMKVGNLNGARLTDTYTLNANFDNIGGLKVRAPVKSSGVVVGRVDAIHYDTKIFQAVVKISLDKRYQFPKDTYATINTAGLLGEQYIGLDPGGDEEVLKPGETMTKTQSAIVLEKLIGQFLFNKAAEAPQAANAPASAPAQPAAAKLN